MKNFDQIFILITEHVKNNEITFNSDLLETGVVNIILLLGILVINGNNLLGKTLQERKEIISANIQDAEKRFAEAKKRFAEAEKQLSQATIIFNKIKTETLNTKKLMLSSDLIETKKDLRIRFERAIATFKSKERQIFLEIKQQIISLVLSQTVIKARKSFEPRKNALSLIDETIKKLEKESL